ncbi:hypothetical protein N1851_009644 [Merluccius polli]|uniref:BED-type domain-containing protein n=1 Tax=Merluccius polli TaxID=89951 RepID=A0AA47P6R9_MERPO|nr:hypothetical protein N1851_009644 [Merluccius polli]
MASSVFAEPEDPYAHRRNNPPGGKPTGVLCGEPSAPLRRGGNHHSADPAIWKRNSTSVVCNYFGQVLCRACRALVATSRGNTTKLFQHLKKYHKSMYDSCMAKMPSSVPDKPNTSRQGSLTEMFESVTPYERNSKWHGEITRTITRVHSQRYDASQHGDLA